MLKKTILFVALLPAIAAAQSARIGDDYAVAALRALIHAQRFGSPGDFSPKQWEYIDEADALATTEAEQQSIEVIKIIITGSWSLNHSSQAARCYIALKAALKKRDGTTPESCK